MTTADTYTRLIALLDEHGAQYRLIDHAPEGRTEIVSPMRGNALSQAAKCIVLMVKIGKKITKYVLAVVPGDTRVDLNAVKTLMKGTYVSFASPGIAERLAGRWRARSSPSPSILSWSWSSTPHSWRTTSCTSTRRVWIDRWS
jgi:Ala-tRNA(Pro) deacylase